MKPHSAKGPHLLPLIEPLESRIAPATMRIGALGTKENITDTEYREFVDPLDPNKGPRPDPFNSISFVDTSVATDPISLAADPLRAADGNNTFYVRLNAGDQIDHFTDANNYKPLIIVRRGHVVAFFTDLNGNNEYDANELTGLSLGANASVEVDGNVNGDIVTNLNEHRTANVEDDTVDMNSLVSTRQGIRDLKVLGGSVIGDVLSGGNISSITIARNVENVLAGSAATNKAFDFFTGSAGGEGSATLALPPGTLGASIARAQIFSITDRLEAGRGGPGGRGGSLALIQITGDTDGFQLLAGAGGAGDVTLNRPNGGLGGVVKGVFVTGVEDPSPNSPLAIVVKSGAGGDGVNTGRGGQGGYLSNVFVGFESVAGLVVSSGELGSDSVVLRAGAGGAGKFGGVAGGVDTVKVRVRTPDVAGEEIFVAGGLGGSSLSPGGRAGAGGSVSTADIRNQILSPNSDILILGGNGGTTVGDSLGANGGSLVGLQLLGYDIQTVAGDGSDGRSGGIGGSIRGINVIPDEFILTQNLFINAGKGGDASSGNGGAGGAINGINIPQSDLEALLINSGIAANGGAAFRGVGGAGGGVANVAITDVDGEQAVIEGTAILRTGSGGDGTRRGGAGGNFIIVDIQSHALSLDAMAGAGGNGTGFGNGGRGGGYNIFNFVSTGQINGLDVSGTVHAGVGGDGSGLRKDGGAGGSAVKVSMDFDGDASLFAGKGGSGQVTSGAVAGGAAGAGGSIQSSGVFAFHGSGEIRAGDGGTDGARPGNGGGILGDPTTVLINGVPTPNLLVGLRANKNVTVVAGNGTNGGAGGDIRNLTYGSTAQLLVPTPAGTILIEAGDGSGEGPFAGRGGSIDGINGAVGSAPNLPTTLLAGHGGGGPNVLLSGNGGSISNISLSRGGGDGVVVRIQAGDAGDSPLARTGGAGGYVKTVGISNIDDQTILRSIGAGDGGDARVRGGRGGSIVEVRVEDHDIGLRTGAAFGYDRMGGLFVGIGGEAVRTGLAGTVSTVHADAIAAIVAGRGNVPAMAELVTKVYVNGGEKDLLLQRNGALVPNGPFVLKFGVDQTPQLAGGSTIAEVKNALNALPGIAAAGGVDVEITPSGGYKVTFVQNGQRVPITGIETVPTDTVEVIQGSTQNATATEITAGTQTLTVVEFRSGQDPLTLTETVPGTSFFSTTETRRAINGLTEVQELSLTGLAIFPTGQFDMTFGTDITPKLGSNATAAQIATALNALPSIIAEGGVTVQDSTGLPRVFIITFATPDLDEAPILIQSYVPETQRVDLGTLSAFPTGKFSLTFLGNTTTQIAAGATAANVAAALNALPSITTAGGVTVRSPILGSFDITFNTVGDQVSILGDTFVPETQTLALGNFANAPAGSFTISFGTETTAPLPPNASTFQIQSALNALPGIQAAGNVAVTGGIQNTFSITFGTIGERDPLSAIGIRPEVQSIGLNAVTSVDTGEFTLHIDHFAKVTETKAGTTVAVPTTTTRQGVSVDALVTTVSNGTPDPNGAVEVQFLDLFPIVRFTTPLTIGQSEFYLTYAGQRTAFLPILATAAQIDTALEGIPAIAALAPNPPIPGLTGGVTVTADAVAQAFTITFNAAGDRTQITGVGGFRELQTIDTALAAAAAGGEVVFTLGGTPSIPLPGSPTVAQLDTALDPLANGLLLGGVTVTQTNPNRFSIRYDEFGDAPQLFGQGGGTAQHEIQRLDLSQYATLANTEFTLTFVDGISATLPVTANATDIKTALNAVSTIKGVRTDNTGAINVTTVSPNVFDIDFNIFGNQPAIIGLLTKSGGTTVRLPYNATAQAIETALDAVSIADTIVTPGTAAGTFQVTYTEFGDQPNVSSVGYIHEKQKIDVYHVGSFQLSFNNQTTGTLPANATAQQVQDALNALPTVMATGKPVTVKSNADSSYNVVFGADNDQLPFSGVQFEDLVVSTGADGSGSVREIQFITAVKKGEFNSLFYRTNARLLGAITDLNELDSNVFKSFTDTNGNGILDLGLDLIHAGSFILGDIPIDGLVMAKRFDQVNTNVTPEAKLTFAGFFDNDNLI